MCSYEDHYEEVIHDRSLPITMINDFLLIRAMGVLPNLEEQNSLVDLQHEEVQIHPKKETVSLS